MNTPPNPNQFDLPILFDSAVPLLLLVAVLHAYVAIALMAAARKTGTPNGWLAWFPFLNLFLMCAIGRQSYGWVLLCLIPGLNLIALAVIWAGMASSRGKPGWTGILVLVPLVNLLLPLYIAAGGTAAPLADAARVCPACGVPAAAADRFCGECGRAIPVSGPAAKSSGCALGGCGVVAVVFGLMVLACCGGGGFFLLQETPYTPPQRQPPQLPPRLAGTLTEFPLDTVPGTPARPTSVVTQTFSGGKAPVSAQVPQGQLPPGLPPESLPQLTSTMTSATYRAGPKGPPIYIYVLEATGNSSLGGEITDRVVRAAGGKRAGVRVQSPGGRTYAGARIDTPRDATFILVGPTAQICILIYVPDRSAAEVAARLAGNVGNGRGLLDPEFGASLGVLPARLPEDFTLREIQMIGAEEILAAGQNATSWEGRKNDAQLRETMTQLRQFLPEHITGAQYTDRGQREWNVLVCDYGRPRKANWIYLLLRGTVGLNAASSLEFQGGAIVLEDQGQRILVYRKGPYVVVVSGPQSQPLRLLTDFAAGLQL